jgi:hypothetical protein
MLTGRKGCASGAGPGAGLLSAAAQGWLLGDCERKGNGASGQEAGRRGRVAGTEEVLLRKREKRGGNVTDARTRSECRRSSGDVKPETAAA